METNYTVDESAGPVNVCVNLTEPQTDILDETVNVFVIDFPSSIYIPANATLASESTFHIMQELRLTLSTSPSP